MAGQIRCNDTAVGSQQRRQHGKGSGVVLPAMQGQHGRGLRITPEAERALLTIGEAKAQFHAGPDVHGSADRRQPEQQTGLTDVDQVDVQRIHFAG